MIKNQISNFFSWEAKPFNLNINIIFSIHKLMDYKNILKPYNSFKKKKKNWKCAFLPNLG